MGWVINTLAKLILRGLCELFAILAEDFITIFGINIGADFPAIGGADKSLADVIASYGGGLTSVFDTMFPMSQFKKLLVGMAVTIATGLLILELMKALAAPMTGGRKQHPVTSIWKYVVAIPGVILSYRIFICLEYVGNEFYRTFGEAAIKGMTPAEGTLSDIFATTSSGEAAVGTSIFDSLYMVGGGAVDIYGGAALHGIAATIFNLFIIWLVFTNFLRLMIEIMERYVVMGMLFYTAPLPFATLASDETSHIFSSWLKMTLSQMLLMITNGLFVSVFIAALIKVQDLGGDGFFSGVTISGRLSWAIYMLLLVGWLLLAQRFDSYLNSLGLSTAQTGGGLASSVRSGMIAVGSLAAGMTAAYKGSDLRKNLKSAPLSARPRIQAESTKNTVGSAADKLLGKSDSRFAQAQRNENSRASLARDARIGGAGGAANQLLKNGQLSGDDAAKLMSANTRNNPMVNRSIQEGSDHVAGLNEKGDFALSWKDKDGKPMSMTFGESAKGMSIGSVGGMNASLSGAQSSLDAIASNGGASVTARAAQSLASHMNQQPGGGGYQAKIADGQPIITDAASGMGYRIGLSGAEGFEGATPIGGDFVAMPMDKAIAQSAQRIDQMESLQASRDKFFQGIDSGNYNSASMLSGVLSGATKGDLCDMTGASNLKMLLDNAEVTGHGDGTYSISTNDGGIARLSIFDPEAGGSYVKNDMGLPMKIEAESAGMDAGLENILLALNPGTQKEAASFAKFLAGATGEEVTFELHPGGGGYYDIIASDTIIGRVTSASVMPVLNDSNYDWSIQGDYAFSLNEVGQEFFAENTGNDSWKKEL